MINEHKKFFVDNYNPEETVINLKKVTDKLRESSKLLVYEESALKNKIVEFDNYNVSFVVLVLSSDPVNQG